jgi:hypothetical protein
MLQIEEWEGQLDSISTVIWDDMTPGKMVLHRGVGGGTAKRIWDAYENGEVLPGYVHKNGGLVSTSLSLNQAMGFMSSSYPVRLKILFDDDDRGFGFGNDFELSDEVEILLDRGTKFEVLQINEILPDDLTDVEKQRFRNVPYVLELVVRIVD